MTTDTRRISRRTMIAQTGVAAAAVAAAGQLRAETEGKPVEQPSPFRFSLNTATVRGQKISLVEEVEIAAGMRPT